MQAFTSSRWSQASNRSGSRSVGRSRQARTRAFWTASDARSAIPEHEPGGRVEAGDRGACQHGEGVMIALPRSHHEVSRHHAPQAVARLRWPRSPSMASRSGARLQLRQAQAATPSKRASVEVVHGQAGLRVPSPASLRRRPAGSMDVCRPQFTTRSSGGPGVRPEIVVDDLTAVRRPVARRTRFRDPRGRSLASACRRRHRRSRAGPGTNVVASTRWLNRIRFPSGDQRG